MEMTEEGIGEPEDRSIEIIQLKQEKENRFWKVTWALETCSGIAKDLTFALLESQKWIEAEKIFEKWVAENSPDLVKAEKN